MPTGRDRSLFLHSRNPLLLPAVAMAAGVVVDRLASLAPAGEAAAFAGAVTLVFVAAPLARLGLSRIGLLAAIAAAGALRHNAYWNDYPANHPAALLPAGRVIAEFEGVVADAPTVRPLASGPVAAAHHRGNRIGFRLEAEKLLRPEGDLAVEGAIRVTVTDADAGPVGFGQGDRVRVVAAYSRVGAPDNPGEYDWRDYYGRQRILLRGHCESPAAVRNLGPDDRDPWTAWLAGVRQAVREPIRQADLTEPQRRFLAALLVGDKQDLDEELLEDLGLTGTTYFIVVSGQNVMLVVLWVYWLFSWPLGRRWAALPAYGALALYLLVVDQQPPIVRAGVTAAVLLAGFLIGRGPQFLNSLALAAMVILWLNPTDLFDAGAQLSFLCTAALVMLGPRVQRGLFGDPLPDNSDSDAGHPTLAWLRQTGRSLARLPALWISLNLAAWIASVPLSACLFHNLSLINPIVSIVANPFACLSMVVGFFGLVIGAVWPWAGNWLLIAAAWSGEVFAGWIHWSASLGWPHLYIVGVTAFTALAAYTVMLLWLARERLGLARPVIVLAFAALLVRHAVSSARSHSARQPLRLTVLSVGHGLCAVGETPAGGVWLYDAGTTRAGDIGRSTLRPFLDYRLVRAIDAVFISHPHLDHFSGLPGLMKRTPVQAVSAGPYYADLSAGSPPAMAFLRVLAERGIPLGVLARGDVLQLGPATTAEVLWPPAGHSPDKFTVNDSSLVMKVRHAGFSVLFTGDIGPAAQAVLRTDPNLPSDVLIMPHHGSTTGDPAAFLAAVRPRVMVISSDVHKPRNLDPLLSRLPADIAVYHTNEVGAVEMEMGEDGLRVKGFRGGREMTIPSRE